MKTNTKYLIYILLLSQIWVNTVLYIDSILSKNFNNIELITNEFELITNEFELGDINEKELDDKLNTKLNIVAFYKIKINNNFFMKKEITPMCNLKISLPPPEFLIFTT